MKLRILSFTLNFTLPDLEGNMYASNISPERVILVNFGVAECPRGVRADQEWNAPRSGGCIASEKTILFQDTAYQGVELNYMQAPLHLFKIDPDGILRDQGTPARHYLKDAMYALLRADAPDPCRTRPSAVPSYRLPNR